VDIRRSGSFGKTTSIGIRGLNPNQMQVLVDGVRVKSPTLGQVDLADIAPESIERIEIIRGPQSTIYGADAIGGVVQIITKRGSGPPTAYASQEVGNYDTYRAKTGISGAWKAFDYSLGYYHLESNGLTINDGMNQNAVAGRFGLDIPWGNTRLSGAVRYNKTDTGVPIEFVGNPAPIVPTIDPNTHQESETYTATVDLRTTGDTGTSSPSSIHPTPSPVRQLPSVRPAISPAHSSRAATRSRGSAISTSASGVPPPSASSGGRSRPTCRAPAASDPTAGLGRGSSSSSSASSTASS
jgi:outer membrane receptor protein involved in Fe transport